MKSFLIKALPHLVALIIFATLSSLFFKPLTEGYNLRQPDQENGYASGKAVLDYRLANSEEALWSDNLFSGMPAYQIQMQFSRTIANILSDVMTFGLTRDIAILFKCMLGFYILALCLRINPWLSITGAVCFGLGTFNILYLGAGHVSKVDSFSYIAPALGGLILAFRGKWLLGATIFATFVAINIKAGHLQMTYYMFLLCAAVGISEGIGLLIKKDFTYLLKVSSALLIAGLLGFMVSCASVLMTKEYAEYTIRGKKELTIQPDGKPAESEVKEGLNLDYILEYNYAPREQLSLFIPNAKGGKSGQLGKDKQLMKTVPAKLREDLGGQNQYWGDQSYTAGPFYVGAAIMFLFLLSFVVLKDSIRWPFLIITLLSLGLCLQELTWLNEFFIYKFPYYNKFRDTKMILVLVQIMAPISALLLINQLIKSEFTAQTKKVFLIGLGSTLLLALVVCLAPKVSGSFLSKNETEQFEALEKESGGELSRLEDFKEALTNVRMEVYKDDGQRSLLIVIGVTLILVLLAFKKPPLWATVVVFGALIVSDLWLVDIRYLNNEKSKGQYVYYEKKASQNIPYEADVCDNAILETERKKIPDFDTKAANLKKAMKESNSYKSVKDDKALTMISDFGALNLNSNYRVLLLNNGVFSDSKISFFHKSIGGYNPAKLRRYQDLWEFQISQELNGITEAFKSRNRASIDSAMAASNALNMLNTRYIKYNPEAPPILDSNALGNAWFVEEVQIVPNADAEILAVGKIDPKKTAVVDTRFNQMLKGNSFASSNSSINLEVYGTKKLTYSSHSDVEAPAIFSEIYYPKGWVCRIDGNETPYFCANYVLRGVMVPAGDHKIEWSFEPEVYAKGNRLMFIGSLLLALLILVTLFFEIKPLLSKNNVQMK